MKARSTRSRSSALQTRGGVVAATGCVLLTAGLWRIDGVLAALGLSAWCLLALVFALGRANLAKLEARLEAPDKVTAGAIFPLCLTIGNPRGFLDAFGIEFSIEFPGKSRIGGRAAWISAGSAADVELRAAIPARGAPTRHPVRLESPFPLGLFRFRRGLEIERPLVIFPRPVVPRALRAPGVLMDASPIQGASTGEGPGEPRGLRLLQHGDSARRIHWPATLRAQATGAPPLVRQNDPPGFHPRSCVVLFHSFGADGSLIRPDRFERALSLAAGALRHLHGLGIPTTFAADFDGWTERPATTRQQLARCLQALAQASRAAGTEAHNLQSAAAGAGDERSLIVISDMPVAAWRAVLPKRALAAVALEPLRRERNRRA